MTYNPIMNDINNYIKSHSKICGGGDFIQTYNSKEEEYNISFISMLYSPTNYDGGANIIQNYSPEERIYFIYEKILKSGLPSFEEFLSKNILCLNYTSDVEYRSILSNYNTVEVNYVENGMKPKIVTKEYKINRK